MRTNTPEAIAPKVMNSLDAAARCLHTVTL